MMSRLATSPFVLSTPYIDTALQFHPSLKEKKKAVAETRDSHATDGPLSTKITELSFLSFLSRSLCSRYHICTCMHTRLHGTMHTRIRLSRPTLFQTPMSWSLHVPDARMNSPPPLASAITTSHVPRRACAFSTACSYTMDVTPEGQDTARDTTRRSTTGRRSCTF